VTDPCLVSRSLKILPAERSIHHLLVVNSAHQLYNVCQTLKEWTANVVRHEIEPAMAIGLLQGKVALVAEKKAVVLS
jgi:hypothetical protein